MYLSEIAINNYRGIRNLSITFNPNLNVIIGENGSHKSALIDAIRLLYSIGEQQRNIYVSNEDFYFDSESKMPASRIEISYKFSNLTPEEKGAYNEFLVCSSVDVKYDFLSINLIYDARDGRSPSFSYYTGADPGQRAEIKNFELFQHYYLSPLRNSTRDLLNSRGSVLSYLLMRRIHESNAQENFEKIISEANAQLLKQNEIITTQSGINTNLEKIFQKYPENKVGLQIEKSKIDSVINLIKPYLPFNATTLIGDGFTLEQNSLGFNNLIYISIVLGDIEQRIITEKNCHFALLIEEPEAHLHPQVLLSLYNFLTSSSTSNNTQLFITTHSPTLTSKVPLHNLILLDQGNAFPIGDCFTDREVEKILQDTANSKPLTESDFEYKKKQLERYIDVTRSQLFYAKGILFVEGIAEELLIPAFCRILGFKLEDFRLELVNVGGISFYPFLSLFNSKNSAKSLSKKVAVLTDDDRYVDSRDKKYSFDKLIEDNYSNLLELQTNLADSTPVRRINNLAKFIESNSRIVLQTALKTFEYEISIHNITSNKSSIETNLFVKYIKQKDTVKFNRVQEFYSSLPNEKLSDNEKSQIAILCWKLIVDKADFAQDFALHIMEHIEDAKKNFIVPPYIIQALSHLTSK